MGSVRSAAKAKQVSKADAAAGSRSRRLLEVTDAEACVRVLDELRPYGIVKDAGYSATGAVEDVDDEEAHLVVATTSLRIGSPCPLSRLAISQVREHPAGPRSREARRRAPGDHTGPSGCLSPRTRRHLRQSNAATLRS